MYRGLVQLEQFAKVTHESLISSPEEEELFEGMRNNPNCKVIDIDLTSPQEESK